MPHEPAPVAEGEILAGKYRVEKVLGSGGMGVVVAATHITLRQRVAIKFLLHGASEEIITRFLREARAAVRLKSDHVAKIIDVGELENGAPFMVMEYLEGSDLAATVRAQAKLPVATAVDYLLQACEAIAEAHTVGIIHRDLKPANLFLTKGADGSPMIKVLDFGISKDGGGEGAEEEQGLTKTTAVLGSPMYMAPEQMRSTKSVDPRADIWSLGIILYQLLTKTVPYKAPSFLELVVMVLHEDAAPPSTRRGDIPPLLEAAMMKCLKRDRDLRFANVAELAAAIAPFGGPDARRSAERIARTQGVAPPAAEAGLVVEGTPEPAPVSGRSGSHLTRSAQPAPISTLDSAKPSTPSHAPSAASSIEPPPLSGRAQGKTADAWATADSAALKASAPERRPAWRFWAFAGVGLVAGGVVAWLVVFSARAHGPDAAPSATSAASPAEPPAATAAASPSAPVEATSAAPSASTAPAASSDADARPTESSAPPASPHKTPRPRASADARAPTTAHAETAPPGTARPAPSAATSAAKPKKNPLDLEIQ